MIGLFKTAAVAGGKTLLGRAQRKAVQRVAQQMRGKTATDRAYAVATVLIQLGKEADLDPYELADHLRTLANFLDANAPKGGMAKDDEERLRRLLDGGAR